MKLTNIKPTEIKPIDIKSRMPNITKDPSKTNTRRIEM